MELSTTVAVFIPAGARINRVGLKRRSFEQRYGIQFQIDTSNRQVMLIGPADQVEQARNELELFLSQIAVGNSPMTVPKAKNALTSDQMRTFRSLSIRKGPSFTWQFQPTSKPAIDVDIKQFPCELVRTGVANETRSIEVEIPIVNNFHEAYLSAISNPFKQLTQSDGIRVTAMLGRSLYSPTSPNAHGEMSWDQLQRLRRGIDLCSAWSNICDSSSIEIQSLIAKLQSVQEAEGAEYKDVMVVTIKSPENVVVKARYYRRPGGNWEFKRSYIGNKDHIIHDISLSDKIGLKKKKIVFVATQRRRRSELRGSTPSIFTTLLTEICGGPRSLSRTSCQGFAVAPSCRLAEGRSSHTMNFASN